MSEELITRTVRLDDVDIRAAKSDDGSRIVTVLAVPYERETKLWGDVHEVFRRGALKQQVRAIHRVRFTESHHGRAFGRATAAEDRDDGFHVTFRVPDRPELPHAREMLALLDEGILDEVSIGFVPVKGGTRETQRKDGSILLERTKATLDHVALVRAGAYGAQGSKVLTVRDDDRSRLEAHRARIAMLDGRTTPM
jgi:uncharacterized protein